jgi:hypothetical protein
MSELFEYMVILLLCVLSSCICLFTSYGLKYVIYVMAFLHR